MKNVKMAALTSALLTLAGCSMLGIETKRVDYKKQAVSVPALEIPPGLSTPNTDGRYTIPGSEGESVASYSEYAQGGQAADGRVVRGPSVLPQSKTVRIEREGARRWLVTSEQAENVWPQVKEFWLANGFNIVSENSQAGLIETDWAENRAKIPQGGLRNVIGKVFDGIYSSPQKDMYRARLERSKDGKGTEVYITHFGKEEVQTDNGNSTKWVNLPNDPEQEAAMLQMLVVKLGGVAEVDAKALAAGDAAAVGSGVARLQELAGGSKIIQLGEPFDKSWRRVGLAIERAGLRVEDKNRADGVYFVVSGAQQEEKGLLDRLKFWQGDDEPKHFRVTVRDGGAGCEVSATTPNDAGDADAQKLIEALYKQIDK
ncbi:MAG: outer membrane protein assembly factor BamC [Nitrosomonadales bacterium]|nr:outer membrane protein assembly factor BamC [Nitrosomonadales bacterium]